mgnify:CR=1 FL=1
MYVKGQTQAVTAVMITGILIGTVAAVYVWGTPLLEKRQSQAELNQVENDVVSLGNSIESVANSGSGAASESNIRISEGEVFVNETGNYIEVTSFSQNPPYPTEAWRIIDGSNLQGLTIGAGDYGIQGQDTPGVVAARATQGGTESQIRYRIEFRNLFDSGDDEMSYIDINSAGSPRITGETSLSVSNQGIERDEFALETGENVDREKTELRVTLS